MTWPHDEIVTNAISSCMIHLQYDKMLFFLHAFALCEQYHRLCTAGLVVGQINLLERYGTIYDDFDLEDSSCYEIRYY